MSIVAGFDVTSANLPHIPAGQHQLAGYTTQAHPGDGIAWTAEQWAAHPGAIRIDQDPAATDHTADVLDVERGAATIADAGPWYRAAVASYHTGRRPGQRFPAIYVSQSQVTPLANGLIAEGVTSGPRIIIADWPVAEQVAISDVIHASGPFPLAGFQYDSGQFYDFDVWSEAWLSVVSKAPPHLVSVELISRWSDGSARTYTA